MNLFDMNIIEHPVLAADEAWIITDRNAPRIPHSLRDKLPVPCILTGNAKQATQTLKLLRAVSCVQTFA